MSVRMGAITLVYKNFQHYDNIIFSILSTCIRVLLNEISILPPCDEIIVFSIIKVLNRLQAFGASDPSSLPDGQSIACPTRLSLYIFLIYDIYYLCCMCIDFYDLSAWDGCWFVVYITRFILQIFKCVSI